MAACRVLTVVIMLFSFHFCVGDKVNINQIIEQSLAKANERNREEGHTYVEKRNGELANITFEGMTLLGLDSVRKTGDCTMDAEGGRSMFELHLGLVLLQFFFKKVNADGVSFSASLRIDRNSLMLVYTLKNETRDLCGVTVEKLKVEEAKGIILYSSHPRYFGKEITDVFQKYVIPEVNRNLKRDKYIVEEVLERRYCNDLQAAPENDHIYFDVVKTVLTRMMG